VTKGSKLISKAGKVIENLMAVANKVMDKAGDTISGALDKVMTKAKGLASNFSPADLANKLKGKLNDLLMKSPKLANGLKTAGGMATGFMQNLLISETMNYGLEQLSQYVDSDTITKAMILLSMLNSKSKKNQNQGITSNNKNSGDSGSSKSSGDNKDGKKDTKDGESSKNEPGKLNKNGLTSEQEKHYRNKIDEAEKRGNNKAADDARYERYVQKQKNLGKQPLSRDKWDVVNDRLKNSSQRGATEEGKGRQALEGQ